MRTGDRGRTLSSVDLIGESGCLNFHQTLVAPVTAVTFPFSWHARNLNLNHTASALISPGASRCSLAKKLHRV